MQTISLYLEQGSYGHLYVTAHGFNVMCNRPTVQNVLSKNSPLSVRLRELHCELQVFSIHLLKDKQEAITLFWGCLQRLFLATTCGNAL